MENEILRLIEETDATLKGDLVQKAAITTEYFDRDKWDKKIVKAVSAALKKVLKANGDATMDEIEQKVKLAVKKTVNKDGIVTKADDEPPDRDWNDPILEEVENMQLRFDVTNPYIEQFIKDRAFRFSFDVNEQTLQTLGESLQDGIAQGESIPQLKERVKRILGFGGGKTGKYPGSKQDNYRARRIARTEVIRASNYSANQAYIQSGVITGKEWLCAAQERTCPYCSKLNGKVVKLEENFFNLGDTYTVLTEDEEGNNITKSMLLNYEDVGAPPLHPNCRCTLVPIVNPKYLRG